MVDSGRNGVDSGAGYLCKELASGFFYFFAFIYFDFLCFPLLFFIFLCFFSSLCFLFISLAFLLFEIHPTTFNELSFEFLSFFRFIFSTSLLLLKRHYLPRIKKGFKTRFNVKSVYLFQLRG